MVNKFFYSFEINKKTNKRMIAKQGMILYFRNILYHSPQK